MLKQRVATATVLVLITLIAVFWLPTSWFALVLALFSLVAASEWCVLAGWGGSRSQRLWLTLIGAAIIITWWFQDYLVPISIVLGVLWWLWVTFTLCLSIQLGRGHVFKAVAGVMVLIPAWAALIYLHQVDVVLVVWLFLIVWLADIGAYFAGKQWGAHKLAPVISPGKTLEGLLGGIVLVAAFAITVAIWRSYDTVCAFLWLGVTVITALFSVVGDLWESKMKRAVNVKDSGSILPGHGGVFDRIDSITAAAPVFTALLYALTRKVGHCIEIH